jgi:hypothetical protein
MPALRNIQDIPGWRAFENDILKGEDLYKNQLQVSQTQVDSLKSYGLNKGLDKEVVNSIVNKATNLPSNNVVKQLNKQVKNNKNTNNARANEKRITNFINSLEPSIELRPAINKIKQNYIRRKKNINSTRSEIKKLLENNKKIKENVSILTKELNEDSTINNSIKELGRTAIKQYRNKTTSYGWTMYKTPNSVRAYIQKQKNKSNAIKQKQKNKSNAINKKQKDIQQANEKRNEEIKKLENENNRKSVLYDNVAKKEAEALIKKFKNPGMFSRQMKYNNAMTALSNIVKRATKRKNEKRNSNLKNRNIENAEQTPRTISTSKRKKALLTVAGAAAIAAKKTAQEAERNALNAKKANNEKKAAQEAERKALNAKKANNEKKAAQEAERNALNAKKANNEKKAAQEAERKALQEKKNKEEVSQVVKGITNKMIQNNRKELRNMIQKANIGSKNKNRFLAMSKNSKISNTEIRKALNNKISQVKTFKNSKEAQEKRKQRAEVKSSNKNANNATELFQQMTQEPKKAVNRLTEGEKKNMQKQLNMAKPKERGLSKLGKKKLNARGVIEGRTNLNKNILNRYMKQVNNAKQAHIISGILKKLEKEKKKALPQQIPLSNIVPENVQTQINGGNRSRWGRIGKVVTSGLALSAGQKLPKQLPSKPGSSTALAIRPGSQVAVVEKPTGLKNTPKINSAPIIKINNGKISPFSTGNTGVATSNLSKKFSFSTNKNAKPFMVKINKKVQKYLNQGKKPESIFRLVAKEVHPNKGGTKQEMQYLQKIKKQMLEGVGEAMTPKKFLPKSNNKSPNVISKALGGAMAPKKQNKNLTKVLNKLSKKAPERKGLIEKTINSAKKSTNFIKKLRQKAKEEKNKEEVSKVVKGITNRVIEKDKSVSSGVKKVGAAMATATAAKKVSNSVKKFKNAGSRTQTLEQAGAGGKKQVKARKGLLSEVHLKFYKNQVKRNNPTARGRELTKLLDELIWQKIQNKSINNNAKNPNIAGKFAGR